VASAASLGLDIVTVAPAEARMRSLRWRRRHMPSVESNSTRNVLRGIERIAGCNASTTKAVSSGGGGWAALRRSLRARAS
jgi:hypothetical protein